MATSGNLIRVEHVVKSYNHGAVMALNDCSLTIQKGEVVAIIGPSGSGKSTLLRCLNLLEVPTTGHIYFNDVDITDKKVDINLHRRKMGMVFQHFNLFPHMTVLKNITLAPVQLKLKTQAEAEEIKQSQMEVLERISGFTAEEAKTRLFSEIEAKTRHESARMIRQIEMEARETADRKAKEILCNVIQRYAGDYVNEQTVTAVPLPSEDMKGRIIGREGRNIRALEAATGVDLIIDDTPETVILSAYSPLRRQVAKMALERLIQDGRIHPARIEDIVQKCEQELDTQVREVGEQATFDAGVHGIHPEIVRLLGQLRYRTSFTQNVLQHSLEVSALCGMMAAELGMDVKKAKRAGLLHDIGKAVDHEVEGPHALIGADLAKKYNESQEIIHAIAAHHEDQRPSTALAVLVQAAEDDVDLCPLQGLPGVVNVRTVSDVAAALAAPKAPDLPPDYLALDPELPRWKERLGL